MSQVISRQRVADHGEVFTAQREVNAMLDLVKHETERVESRFLEPACGRGVFLIEVLHRKLAVVAERHSSTQLEWERYALLALTSIYGIELLADNTAACRQNLLEVFTKAYQAQPFKQSKEELVSSAAYVLTCNIIQGDALTLQTVGPHPQPIVFAEWSPVNGTLIKRRDYTLQRLIQKEAYLGTPLFSDQGEQAYIPKAEREYPLTHFLKLYTQDPSYADNHQPAQPNAEGL